MILVMLSLESKPFKSSILLQLLFTCYLSMFFLFFLVSHKIFSLETRLWLSTCLPHLKMQQLCPSHLNMHNCYLVVSIFRREIQFKCTNMNTGLFWPWKKKSTLLATWLYSVFQSFFQFTQPYLKYPGYKRTTFNTFTITNSEDWGITYPLTAWKKNKQRTNRES